jgi:hypothetical protein
MQKFTQFMKSRKGLLLLAIVLFGGLFFAFRSSVTVQPISCLHKDKDYYQQVGADPYGTAL